MEGTTPTGLFVNSDSNTQFYRHPSPLPPPLCMEGMILSAPYGDKIVIPRPFDGPKFQIPIGSFQTLPYLGGEMEIMSQVVVHIWDKLFHWISPLDNSVVRTNEVMFKVITSRESLHSKVLWNLLTTSKLYHYSTFEGWGGGIIITLGTQFQLQNQ